MLWPTDSHMQSVTDRFRGTHLEIVRVMQYMHFNNYQPKACLTQNTVQYGILGQVRVLSSNRAWG